MDKPIILIAVDDEGARRSIAELLHGQGYDVLDAAGRCEVMACVSRTRPGPRHGRVLSGYDVGCFGGRA